MEKIQIKADDFFELLKLRDVSMWEIFSQMIDGKEKELVFLNKEDEILFHYILPKTIEKLEEDRQFFSKEYTTKIINSN